MSERKTAYNARCPRQTFGYNDTAQDLMQYVGKKADYRATKELWIEVEILSTRMSWGQVHYLITPVNGSGSQWVASGLTLRE